MSMLGSYFNVGDTVYCIALEDAAEQLLSLNVPYTVTAVSPNGRGIGVEGGNGVLFPARLFALANPKVQTDRAMALYGELTPEKREELYAKNLKRAAESVETVKKAAIASVPDEVARLKKRVVTLETAISIAGNQVLSVELLVREQTEQLKALSGELYHLRNKRWWHSLKFW